MLLCEPRGLFSMQSLGYGKQNLNTIKVSNDQRVVLRLVSALLQNSWGISRVPALAPPVREICRHELLQ